MVLTSSKWYVVLVDAQMTVNTHPHTRTHTYTHVWSHLVSRDVDVRDLVLGHAGVVEAREAVPRGAVELVDQQRLERVPFFVWGAKRE